MPYNDKSKRRKWESRPDQKSKTADRQAQHRERKDKIQSLVAPYKILQHNPQATIVGPALRAQVEQHRPEIEQHLSSLSRQKVQVYQDGKRIK